MLGYQAARVEDVREDALRLTGPSSRNFWALVAGLAILVGWGLIAYAYQLWTGLASAATQTVPSGAFTRPISSLSSP